MGLRFEGKEIGRLNNTQIKQKQADEKNVRNLFNKKFNASLINGEKRLQIGQFANHKFDIYEQGKYIGGITTSPWTVGNNSQNTGGKDRISAELLWLCLWQGEEHRCMVITKKWPLKCTKYGEVAHFQTK